MNSHAINNIHSTRRKRAESARKIAGGSDMTIARTFSVFLSSALAFAAQAGTSNNEVDQHQTGTKYSALQQINRGNVADLELAWEYHTGEVPPKDTADNLIAFEDQPSLIAGNLIVCTTSRRIIALDPATGKERWAFDPRDRKVGMRKCRGIASWVDKEAPTGSDCKTRIFLGTSDNRLVAIDATNGKACSSFGQQGMVDIPLSKPEIFPGEVVASSRPAVVNDVVVVGSAVADNQRVDAPSGRVSAFDARTGKAKWQFDPLPRDPNDPAAQSWEAGTAEGFGGGNAWAAMAADQALDLVYLPTSSASGDFYGEGRAGDNHYSTSVVALKGATGEVAWHYQLVHHNVFDYDIPSQPLLIDWPQGDGFVPALVQNTKMGLVFVFNRETGEPLLPIEERAVPQVGVVAGEKLSPTQPFPANMPSLMPEGFTPDDAWGFTFIDEWFCERQVKELNYGPIYTPVSERGTVFWPSAGGGPNWGGGAYDPDSHIMVVPSNRVPMAITLIPAGQAAPVTGDTNKTDITKGFNFPIAGSAYHYKITPLMSPLGAPCSKPPWAVLTALDLVKRKILWEASLGDIGKMTGLPFSLEYGTPGAGGPLTTAGGLVFIGYTLDDTFRAFDLHTGEVLWQTDLPAAGTAIPVTYEVAGEQYVVIPAGGHSMYQSTLGDSVMAYRLRKP
ncbi:MAG: quinoprotein glucose dehydrogenase [Halieaceae bacterium]|jgi:quinoprotein glucose dehydrogenase